METIMGKNPLFLQPARHQSQVWICNATDFIC